MNWRSAYQRAFRLARRQEATKKRMQAAFWKERIGIWRLAGQRGGTTRAARLTAEQRTAIASHAAKMMWTKMRSYGLKRNRVYTKSAGKKEGASMRGKHGKKKKGY